MTSNFQETMKIEVEKEDRPEASDPTYITSHNNARSMIKRLERDELLEELVKAYVKE
ncbi:MAG: hypothetical protein K0Q65_2891 [Clostridia bacterium]|nr:hypothetical protein [Clostridia bacterium]